MRTLLTIICVLLQFISYGQEIAKCIEILGEDSIQLYFNSNGILVDKECSDFYRIAKINHEGFLFNGHSKDYYSSGQLAVDCNYQNNLFHGEYSAFYSNGQIKEKGKFYEGQKIGEWKYWYDNGQPRKVIIFKDGNYFLQAFYKANGKQLVIDGNGKFKEKSLLPNTVMKGEILNGKQHGKWTISNQLYNGRTGIELFDNGKFIEGKSISQIQSFNGTYFDSQKSLIDYTKDLLYESYVKKIECTEIGQSFEFSFKKYNSKYSDLPFYDYVYQNFDPSELHFGYILAGFTIDILGKLTNTKIYSTINDKAIEEQLQLVLNASETWEPGTLNGEAVESNELFVFQFIAGSYKILGDSRNDYAPVEIGAEYINGMNSLKNYLEKKINLPKYFFEKGFNVSTSIYFFVDELGTCNIDSSLFTDRIKISDDERILYYSVISLFKENDMKWKSATYEGNFTKHYFNGVFTIRNGIPKFRLFSNNWVLN